MCLYVNIYFHSKHTQGKYIKIYMNFKDTTNTERQTKYA